VISSADATSIVVAGVLATDAGGSVVAVDAVVVVPAQAVAVPANRSIAPHAPKYDRTHAFLHLCFL
jgi:hypothetical protein